MKKAILTVTLNPSVDISYPLQHLVIDNVNRVEKASKTAGGKGLNVARVIKQMKTDVITTGFLGGTIGQYISQQLEAKQISEQFMSINQESRNCIAILHDNGKQTEILENGPTISQEDANNFLKHFNNLLNQVNIVTISGSLPAGLEANYYSQLITLARAKNIPVLLDSSGDSLKKSIQANIKPNLIKPNQEEISQLVKQPINNNKQLSNILKNSPLLSDIDWIVVSLGADGALAKVNDDIFEVRIPKINVVNPVGSGDSTVAGLAIGFYNKLSPEDTLKMAMTTGMLNTMETQTGYINYNNCQEYFSKVLVKKIN